MRFADAIAASLFAAFTINLSLAGLRLLPFFSVTTNVFLTMLFTIALLAMQLVLRLLVRLASWPSRTNK